MIEPGLLMLAGGVAAGGFGSLLGLGGGLLIVPLLTLGFGLPLREAVGVSLVSVIATSGAAAGVYLARGVANLRLGMVLELFTALGALAGALVAFALPERLLAALFAGLLLYVAGTFVRSIVRDARAAPSTPPASPTAGSAAPPAYEVRNRGVGLVGSTFAGVVSALFGVGGGIVKVPVMHLVMGVPIRVATATSNLMIGITATSSALVYLLRGGIDPYVAGPTVVGVFLGASVGSRNAHRVDTRLLRALFVAVLVYTAWGMFGRALG